MCRVGGESEVGSSLEPHAGLTPTTVRPWPEPNPRVWRLTDWPTQVPISCLFCFKVRVLLRYNSHTIIFIIFIFLLEATAALNHGTEPSEGQVHDPPLPSGLWHPLHPPHPRGRAIGRWHGWAIHGGKKNKSQLKF